MRYRIIVLGACLLPVAASGTHSAGVRRTWRARAGPRRGARSAPAGCGAARRSIRRSATSIATKVAR